MEEEKLPVEQENEAAGSVKKRKYEPCRTLLIILTEIYSLSSACWLFVLAVKPGLYEAVLLYLIAMLPSYLFKCSPIPVILCMAVILGYWGMLISRGASRKDWRLFIALTVVLIMNLVFGIVMIRQVV